MCARGACEGVLCSVVSVRARLDDTIILTYRVVEALYSSTFALFWHPRAYIWMMYVVSRFPAYSWRLVAECETMFGSRFVQVRAERRRHRFGGAGRFEQP